MGCLCICFKKGKKTFTEQPIFPSDDKNQKFISYSDDEKYNKTNPNYSNIAEINDGRGKISVLDFQKIKVLGRGTFGKVLLVKKNSNHKFYAMKILKKSVVKLKNQVFHTKTERQILERFAHPFIVHLQYAFQDENKLYLVTEFMQGGELFYHLRKEGIFRESRARFYLCEIILALEHLHNNNCMYRDLKPENILIDANGHIKLTDFGLSKLILSKKDEKAYTICGTPEYLAPEIILEKGYDKTVDWWSLGALFYEMLCGFSPFKNLNKTEGPKLDIKNYTKPITIHKFFSEEAKSLIIGLLTINPTARLGAGPKGSTRIKSHPFFKGTDWDAVYNKTLEPPFKPKISETNDTVDLSNFDPIFTKENVFEPASEKRDGICNNSESANMIDSSKPSMRDYNYDGFTYKNQSLSNFEY
jgi:serine/threonine protein kinase